MPLLADENTPYLETPAERMRRLLGQNTQGVAPGIAGSSPSTSTAVPRSQLPAWVQQRLREQEAAAQRPAPTPSVTPPIAHLAPLGPSADPRARADRLREILDSPVTGTAPGIASSASHATTRVAPTSYDDDPYFDDQVAQNERAAYSPWTPSTYRAQRAEDQLWEAELGPGLKGRAGTEGAYDDYLKAQRSPRPGSPGWRPEPVPTAHDEERWVLPSEFVGVPVTADRVGVQFAYRDMGIFGITDEERRYLDELPPDERERVDSVARQLSIEARGRARAEYLGRQRGTAQENEAFTDWRQLFEQATGQPHPDVGGVESLIRDALRLRSGFDSIDDVTASGRNGVILLYTPALQDPADRQQINEILARPYADERERFEAVRKVFPGAKFVVDTSGAGTALREHMEDDGPLGDWAANYVDKALAPATWFSGLAGARTIVPGGTASNLYEEARDAGYSPEVAALLAQLGMWRLNDPRSKGVAWAYARDVVGDRLDDFGPEWSLVPSQLLFPSHDAGAGRGVGGGGGGSFGASGAIPQGRRATGGGAGGSW